MADLRSKGMLKEFSLGREAIGYIASELRRGRGLASHLSSLPLQEGRVVTYLPNDVAQAALLDFESGGMGSGRENAKVAELVAEHLRDSASAPRVCVLEHP